MAKILQSEIAQVGMRIKYMRNDEDDRYIILALPSSTNPNFRIAYSGSPGDAFNHSVHSFNHDFACIPQGLDALKKNLEVFLIQFKSMEIPEELQSTLVELEI